MEGCSKKSSSRKQDFSRKRKRKYHANKYKKQSCSEPGRNLYISASAKKLKVLEETLENARNEKYNYNFIMNFIKLKDVIAEIVKCPECEGTAHIVANKSSRMEFSHMFLVPCSSCDWKKSFYSSKECNNKDIKTQGCKPFEKNVRITVGFCEIGRGFSGTENFTRCMNMHNTAKTSFDKFNHEIAKAYEVSATKSMNTTLEPTKNVQNLMRLGRNVGMHS